MPNEMACYASKENIRMTKINLCNVNGLKLDTSANKLVTPFQVHHDSALAAWYKTRYGLLHIMEMVNNDI